jgi:hypothetical protein
MNGSRRLAQLSGQHGAILLYNEKCYNTQVIFIVFTYEKKVKQPKFLERTRCLRIRYMIANLSNELY